MTPSIRKFSLASHIAVSVGWIGAAFAYLILVLEAMRIRDVSTLRATWLALDVIGWFALVPLALASLATGFIVAAGTPWGLLRHYWVVTSLALTAFAAAVLLQHMQTVSALALMAAAADGSDIAVLRDGLRGELLHSGVGLLVLLAIEVLNVYKPQGLTPYGRRLATLPAVPARLAGGGAGARLSTQTPRWLRVAGIHVAILTLLFLFLHVAGGGTRH